MAYQELIKNFEHIRSYMRDFYVYGFKTRNDFRDHKSARSYDNERRRIESYLGDYMSFHHTPEGKQVFMSIDSRHMTHNPLHEAFKAKSFTNHDITLYFIIMDILYNPKDTFTIQEIIHSIDEDYLSKFPSFTTIDDSTIRKKLKEYCELGLLTGEKQGRTMLYHRSEPMELSSWEDAIHYFSQAGMDGVIGSFLLDHIGKKNSSFTFKHHYINSALDSDILCQLLCAIQDQREVTIHQIAQPSAFSHLLIPLKIFVSTQNGREYLFCYHKQLQRIMSIRLDHIDHVDIGGKDEKFLFYRDYLTQMQKHMWGVCCDERKGLEHVEFTIHLEDHEEYIFHRLQREARCGMAERIDPHTARFTADVYDTLELIPWIRTFICRILQLNFSNRSVENQLKEDIHQMMKLYEIGGDEDAVS